MKMIPIIARSAQPILNVVVILSKILCPDKSCCSIDDSYFFYTKVIFCLLKMLKNSFRSIKIKIFGSFDQQHLAMQINLDLYVRNFRIFYQQLIKGHNRQQHLNKQFKLLVDSELKKWRRSYGVSKISETASDNPLLNKLRQNRRNKQQQKISIDSLYSSEKVENCVAFGYLYLVFEHKNIAAFEFLQDQLKEPLSNKQAYSPPVFRKINFTWSKFNDLISGKKKTARFDRLLSEYFKDLPQTFVTLIYNVIIQEQPLIIENKQIYFQELSDFLTLKIEYFQLNEQQNLKTFVYGPTQKLSIKIGYLKAENMFVSVSKMPEKQEKQLHKEITLEKFIEISNSLNQMYTMNTKEYMNLSNLKNRIESNELGESRRTLKDSRKEVQAPMPEPSSSEFVTI